MDSTEQTEPEWRRCDECGDVYFIAATLNPRRNMYSILPLSEAPAGVQGNFTLTESKEEVSDADGVFYGPRAVAVYGAGRYLPHSPSHFLNEVHADEHPKQRMHNLRLAMDDEEESWRRHES